MTKSLIMIFVKNPVLGKVKTRLAKTMGDEKALEVYRKLLKHTKAQTDLLSLDKVVYYDTEIPERDLWSEGSYDKRVQYHGDLGERMSHAFKEAFSEGYDNVCIIGSDCYQLTTDIINKAFEKLSKNDVVLGPANDGGYYLLGMRTMVEAVFEDKSWSTEQLMAETKSTLEELRMSYTLLHELIDIDTEDDLRASGL